MASERKEPTFSSSATVAADPNAKRAAQPPRAKSPQAKVIVQKQSSGFLWFTFLLVLCIAAGLGFTFWQLQQSQQLVSSQQQRIDELENKLLLSGDESTQSLTVLTSNLKEVDKELKLAMSEVDKLWAARKTNVNAISSLKKGLSSGLAKNNTAISALDTKLSQPVASIDQRSREQDLLIESLRERLGDQDRATQSLAKQVKQFASASKQAQAVSTKVDGYEETIRSFDKFRVTTNRDLLLLKERAGLLSAPAQ